MDLEAPPDIPSHESPTVDTLDFISPGEESFVERDIGGEGELISNTKEYLTRQGFAWLLEEEEDDNDNSHMTLLEELDINLSDILYKLRCVMFPYNVDQTVVVKNPDFWGPLGVILVYSSLIVWGQLSVVSWVLSVWLFGSILILVIARVLGSDVNYSQVLGVLGYCVLPLVVMVLLVWVLELSLRVDTASWGALAIKVVGTLWAAFSASSMLLMTGSVAKKKILIAYPVLLLYVYFTGLLSGV